MALERLHATHLFPAVLSQLATAAHLSILQKQFHRRCAADFGANCLNSDYKVDGRTGVGGLGRAFANCASVFMTQMLRTHGASALFAVRLIFPMAQLLRTRLHPS